MSDFCSLALLQGIFPTQGSNPGLPASQVGSLSAEPQGKAKNAGVGSLSLLQGIFPTQELNWGLLHCRRVLYQLSYEESPFLPCIKTYYKTVVMKTLISIPTYIMENNYELWNIDKGCYKSKEKS